MSREQYTPPNLTGSSSTTNNQNAGGSSTGGGGFNITGASQQFEDGGGAQRPVQYLCGDCDTRVTLKKGDAIRCKECGYRVLYKERTGRLRRDSCYDDLIGKRLHRERESLMYSRMRG